MLKILVSLSLTLIGIVIWLILRNHVEYNSIIGIIWLSTLCNALYGIHLCNKTIHKCDQRIAEIKQQINDIKETSKISTNAPANLRSINIPAGVKMIGYHE